MFRMQFFLEKYFFNLRVIYHFKALLLHYRMHYKFFNLIKVCLFARSMFIKVKKTDRTLLKLYYIILLFIIIKISYFQISELQALRCIFVSSYPSYGPSFSQRLGFLSVFGGKHTEISKSSIISY